MKKLAQFVVIVAVLVAGYGIGRMEVNEYKETIRDRDSRLETLKLNFEWHCRCLEEKDDSAIWMSRYALQASIACMNKECRRVD